MASKSEKDKIFVISCQTPCYESTLEGEVTRLPYLNLAINNVKLIKSLFKADLNPSRLNQKVFHLS